MATTYTTRYVNNRYYHTTSQTDGRSFVPVIAIMFLILSLAAIAYLVDAAYKGYENGYRAPAAQITSTSNLDESDVGADTVRKPVFINSRFKRPGASVR